MKIENAEGKEIEVFTPEEVTARETAAAEAAAKEASDRVMAEKQKELDAVNAELEKVRKVSAEKTTNFKKYNEMTEEERKAHSENEILLLRRHDELEGEVGTLKTRLEEKDKNEKDYTKNSVLKNFHRGDETVKKAIEQNYAHLAGMPESTPDEIAARAASAARLSGITIDPINPLYTPISGEAPAYKENKDYTDSPEGKEAARLVREAMGIPNK
jgi:hypothetical protein